METPDPQKMTPNHTLKQVFLTPPWHSQAFLGMMTFARKFGCLEASFEDTLTLLTQSEADLRKNIADTTKVATGGKGRRWKGIESFTWKVDEWWMHAQLQHTCICIIYIYICNAYAEGFNNHSDRQENQILFYVGVTTHDISFVTDLLQKSSGKLHPRSLVRARFPYAKELADTKKELTEKNEMLEKTTMLGIKNWSIGTFWVEVFCRWEKL